MTQRAVIGLLPGADWAPVKDRLVAAGAEQVRDPSAELPDVLIVSLSSECNMEAFLRQARECPGVRYAEPDAWQFST